MTDWDLSFRESKPVTREMCEGVVSAVVGGPVAIRIGSLEGNPRDYYARVVTLTGDHRDGLQVVMTIGEDLRGPGDPETLTGIRQVTLRGPAASFARKLEAWHQLRDALAAIGCSDRTLAASPAPIVDEAEAAGETALVARLRAGITAALVAEAPSQGIVMLSGSRADDIEAVLAAYVDPQQITYVSVAACGLSALPQGLARFPNIAYLSVAENPIDGRVFRGLARPQLTRLDAYGCAIRQLTRDDVAGFPSLTELHLQGNPLVELDPGIVDVCPRLRRVLIAATPLDRDADQRAALRAHWELG